MTRRMRLADAGIMRLKPGRTDYTVWDTVTPGLGVRSSGFRGYVFHQRGSGTARSCFRPPPIRKGRTERIWHCGPGSVTGPASPASGSTICATRTRVRPS